MIQIRYENKRFSTQSTFYFLIDEMLWSNNQFGASFINENELRIAWEIAAVVASANILDVFYDDIQWSQYEIGFA